MSLLAIPSIRVMFCISNVIPVQFSHPLALLQLRGHGLSRFEPVFQSEWNQIADAAFTGHSHMPACFWSMTRCYVHTYSNVHINGSF